MELLQKNGQLQNLEIKVARAGPNSERAYWIGQIENLTQCPRKALLFKHLSHIPAGEKGLGLLKFIYEEAMTADTEIGRRKRCWWLIKESKVKTV